MSPRQLSVLVADDAGYLRALLGEFIGMLGHSVIEAKDGLEAVSQFEKFQPDLVLMDMIMPNMDGIAATAEIRKQCGERWVPIIMISADDDQDNLVRSLNLGCDDYLIKPVNLQILAAKILAFQRVADMQREMDRQREELRGYRAYAEEELSLTEHIMTRQVRRGDRDNPNLRVWAEAVQGASGDIVLSMQSDNGIQYLMLADATGHGLAAAVTLIPVTNVFYAMASKGFNVASIVEEMNRQVRAFCPVERFVALTLVAVKPQSELIEVWNGGNPPVFVLDAEGAVTRTFRSRHLPLGILDQKDFTANTEFLHYDCDLQLALFSDGLIEAGGAEQFGELRLLNVLSATAPAQRLERLRTEFYQFLGANKPHDDVFFTLLDCPRMLVESTAQPAEPRRASKSGARDWQLDAHLSAEQLKAVDLVPMVVEWAHKMGLSRDRGGSFFTVVTELYINALDHGVLELPSELKQGLDGFERYFELRQSRLQNLVDGEIHLLIQQSQRDGEEVISIRLRDSGGGFPHRSYASNQLSDNAIRSGRGITLVRKLCRNLVYNTQGNEVYAELVV